MAVLLDDRTLVQLFGQHANLFGVLYNGSVVGTCRSKHDLNGNRTDTEDIPDGDFLWCSIHGRQYVYW
mgnify:CR=1 FL=1